MGIRPVRFGGGAFCAWIAVRDFRNGSSASRSLSAAMPASLNDAKGRRLMESPQQADDNSPDMSFIADFVGIIKKQNAVFLPVLRRLPGICVNELRVIMSRTQISP